MEIHSPVLRGNTPAGTQDSQRRRLQGFSATISDENLYRLRHLKGREDKDSEDTVTIENGLMKLKAAGSFDFGSTWEIWSEAFINVCSKQKQ
ncbi:hypothetical protein MMC07_001122 [Pseudocyphellaria aurata]|nr:hypothetical protein [Pseudocyphellaria aurata]